MKIYSLTQKYRRDFGPFVLRIVAVVLAKNLEEAETSLKSAYPAPIPFSPEIESGWFPMTIESVSECSKRMGLSEGVVKAVKGLVRPTANIKNWK